MFPRQSRPANSSRPRLGWGSRLSRSFRLGLMPAVRGGLVPGFRRSLVRGLGRPSIALAVALCFVAAAPPALASGPARDSIQPAVIDPVVAPPPARIVAHGSRTRPVVALTFDDGWDADATRRIVSILRAQHVAATFFPYGYAVRKEPDLWRRIASEGFPIGNHTQSHPDLTRLAVTGVRTQFRLERQTVEPIIGEAMVPFARPPYGAWNEDTARAAAADGYRALVLWDVDSRDWTGIRASAIVKRSVRGRNGSIVLLHAGPEQTVHALKSIIASYRARGFDFVTVPELLGLTNAVLPAIPGGYLPSAPPTLGPRFR